MADYLKDYSTRFEYGTDVDSPGRTEAYVSYTKDAVLRYRAPSIEEVLEKPTLLLDMIKHHKLHQVPRLRILEQYYLNNNAMILHGERRRETDASDHRIRHAFAGIISDFINTYVLSNPVKIEDVADAEKQSDFVGIIDDFNIANDIDSHNLEIGKDQNNFGRAFEILVRTEDDRDKIYRLEPTEVFMIYDETIATRVIGACRYYKENELDRESKYIAELYTYERIHVYEGLDITDQGKKIEESVEKQSEHQFNGVPIIEYRSDRYRMSVFEKQLSQIDAYDAAQSDTANYMTDFNDAILVLEGRIKNAGDAEYMRKMKDARMMVLIPDENYDGRDGTMKASYLTKSYDVAGVEAYKSRLKEDIFTSAAVPNLSDDAFAGNQSGEALKYKLFGLQQKRADKEKYLAKGFRVRYKLLENLKRTISEFSGDEIQLNFIFTPNLPKAFLEELKTFIAAGGRVSQQTMLSILSFIDDVKQEIERIEEEDKNKTTGTDPYGFMVHAEEIAEGLGAEQ